MARRNQPVEPEGIEDVEVTQVGPNEQKSIILGQNTSASDTVAATEGSAEREPRPDGPMETRTGAKGLVVKGRTFTAGGPKGDAIKHLLETRPDMARKEIAAIVGCSQSRVAEVARVLGLQRRVMVSVPETSEDEAEQSA